MFATVLHIEIEWYNNWIYIPKMFYIRITRNSLDILFLKPTKTFLWRCANTLSSSILWNWRIIVFTLLKGHFTCLIILNILIQTKFTITLKMIVGIKNNFNTSVVIVQFIGLDYAYFWFLRWLISLSIKTKVTYIWLFASLIGNESYTSYYNIYFTLLSSLCFITC